jgi:hypothetical protein
MKGRYGGSFVVVLTAMVVVGGPLVGSSVVGHVAASDTEAPLADAGLDQNVTANVTVYLDATGSRDSDGEIDEYEWRLERPDGNYTSPNCRNCGRTSFVALQPGTYNATVTVTDDDGATETDTLHVYVSESNGPSVSLTGPDSVVEGRVAEYSASVSAGASDLAAVRWRFDGRTVNRTDVGGESADADHWQRFSDSGNYTLSVTAVDELGRERTAKTNVTVRDPSSVDVSNTGSESGDTSGRECSRYGRNDDRYCNNDRMTIDTKGITITDVDDDGSTDWAGVEIDEEFAEANDGVSFDSTNDIAEFENKSAYKEAFGMDVVNVNPKAPVNKERNDEVNIVSIADSTFDDSSSGFVTNFVQTRGSNGGISQTQENSQNNSPSESPWGNTSDDENSESETTTTRTGRVPVGDAVSV